MCPYTDFFTGNDIPGTEKLPHKITEKDDKIQYAKSLLSEAVILLKIIEIHKKKAGYADEKKLDLRHAIHCEFLLKIFASVIQEWDLHEDLDFFLQFLLEHGEGLENEDVFKENFYIDPHQGLTKGKNEEHPQIEEYIALQKKLVLFDRFDFGEKDDLMKEIYDYLETETSGYHIADIFFHLIKLPNLLDHEKIKALYTKRKEDKESSYQNFIIISLILEKIGGILDEDTLKQDQIGYAFHMVVPSNHISAKMYLEHYVNLGLDPVSHFVNDDSIAFILQIVRSLSDIYIEGSFHDAEILGKLQVSDSLIESMKTRGKEFLQVIEMAFIGILNGSISEAALYEVLVHTTDEDFIAFIEKHWSKWNIYEKVFQNNEHFKGLLDISQKYHFFGLLYISAMHAEKLTDDNKKKLEEACPEFVKECTFS